MARNYSIKDFMDDEKVEKFINELIEDNLEYLRSKYHQLILAASKSGNNINYNKDSVRLWFKKQFK